MKENHVLLGIDVQNCFMSEGGTLVLPGDMSEVKSNISKLLAANDTIRNLPRNLFTMDGHRPWDEELSDTPDYKTTFPNHAMLSPIYDFRGIETGFTIPKDARLIDEVIPYLKHARLHPVEDGCGLASLSTDIIIKNKFDMFEGNPFSAKILLSTLDRCSTSRVVVYGVATDVCVKFAVEGLLKRDKEIFLVTDACAALDQDKAEELLLEWKTKGVTLITTEEYVTN